MRLRSLDIFRGLTIASMIVVNTAPGAREDTYVFMRHALWNGWTFADTIFPAFLWIVGVALTLSTASRLERGASRASLLRHAATRTALLICLGWLMGLFYFPDRHFPFFGFQEHLQVTGVLQKIAVCYFLAFLIVLWFGWRGALVGVVVLNLAFLALLFFYPVPECGAGSLSAECNFAGYLDQSVFGSHRWIDGNPHGQDPDGFGSVLPATSTVLFGVLIGALLRAKRESKEILRSILGFAAVLILCGAALSEWVIPINKPLWTPSYAFLMAGLSSVVFALCYWAADIRRLSFRVFEPFEVYGRNAIAAYAISTEAANIPKVHVQGTSLYDLCLKIAGVPNAPLLYALGYTAAVFVPIWWMHRRQWFLKF